MQSDSSSDQWQEIESQIQETEALLAEEIAIAQQAPESKALEHIRSVFVRV
jgi:hypothetical protein